MDVQYRRQRRVQSRVEIVVDVSKPLDAKNFGYIMTRLHGSWLPEKRRPYDDAFFVELRDDELIFWWPEDDRTERILPDLPLES